MFAIEGPEPADASFSTVELNVKDYNNQLYELCLFTKTRSHQLHFYSIFKLDLLQGACHLDGGIESGWWRFHQFITDNWFYIGDEQLNAELVEGRPSKLVCHGL